MSEENIKTEYITKEYLNERLAENNHVLLGAIDSMLVNRNAEMKKELKADINNVQTLIDGYVKAQEDFKQEFLIIKEEVKQIKKVIKEKLGLEIKAIG